jgi:TP901 family phage tail tape measure protein
MKGIGLRFSNIEELKKQFDNLLNDLKSKADKNPISINFDDLTKRLVDVENKVNESTKRIGKMTAKSVENALTGVNYKDFQSKLNEVVNGLNKSGNQVSDIFTTIDAKTEAITGATVKYTDSLGKTITEVYKLKTAWKNMKDDEGNFVLDNKGNKVKQLNMELKPSTISYDNNIAKQQQDNYKKLNDLLNSTYNNKKKIAQLDEKSQSGEYANQLRSQISDNERKYNEIYNSVIKIGDEEETLAINAKQTNDLLEKRKKIEQDISLLITKQNDATLRKTSTTTSGQRNLGEEVKLGIPINFEASRADLNAYSKAVAGSGAEWTRVTPKIDAAGNKIKEVNVRVKEGSDKWRMYQMTLDESTGKLYKVDRGLSDLNNRQLGFIESTKIAIARIAEWGISTMAVYGTIRKIREGVEFINSLNKAQTNIQMVGGYSRKEVQGLTSDYSKLADQLYTTTDAIMASSEEFLRAGNSIEETNSLLQATAIGGAISGQESSAMAEQLIAISNGFKMATGDAKQMMSVIDTLSILDNSSATSMKEISEAIMRTASSAQMAGVSFKDLSAYIATVSSVTRKSASSIGESYKSIFSRYQDVKGGKNFDSDEEDISNVERDFRKYADISIRSAKGEFKDFGVVLDELSGKWSTLSTVAKSAVTKALAGTRQRENLLVLLNEMGQVRTLQEKIEEGAGSAKAKFDEAYGKSTEAQINKLTNSTQRLYMSMFNSDMINSAIGGLNTFVEYLQTISESSIETKIGIVALTGVIVAMGIAIKKNGIDSLNTSLASLIPNITKFIFGGQALTTILGGLKTAFSLLLSPVGLVGVAIGVVTVAIAGHIKHQKQLKEQTESLSSSYKNLTNAMKENNAETMKSELDNIKKQQSEMNKLVSERAELEKKIASATPGGGNYSGAAYAMKANQGLYNQLNAVNDKIAEQQKVMDSAGISAKELAKAEMMVSNNEIANQIKKTTEEEYNRKQSISNLIQEYQSLNAIESANTTQKQRMSQIAQELQSNIQGLTVTRDSEGNYIIQNTDLLGKEVNMLNQEGQTIETLTNLKLTDAKNRAEIEVGNTKITYLEAKKRISILQEEMKAYENAMTSRMLGMTDEQDIEKQGRLYERYMSNRQSVLGEYQSSIDALDKIFATGGNYNNVNSLETGTSYTPPGSSSSDKSQSLTIDNANTYSSIIDTQNSLLSQQDSLLSKISDTISQQESSNQITEAISTQNQLYTEQQKKLDLLYQTRDKYTNAEQSVIDAFSSNGWLGDQDIYSMNQQDFDSIYDTEFGGTREFGTGEQAEKDKQAFQDRANLFKSLSSEWLKLKDAMGKTNDDIGKMAYDMNKTLVEMDKNVLESYNKNLEASSKNLTEKMKDLDLQLKQLDEGDLKGSSDILSKKLKLANDELKLRQDYLNQLNGTVTSSVEGEIELRKAIDSASDSVRDQKGVVIDLQKSMKDGLDNQKKLVEDTESKIVDVIKSSVEKQKKALEEKYNKKKELLDKEYNQEKDTLDKIQDLYNRSNETDDYEKNLKKEKEVANNIDSQIANARLDKSLEGQKRLRELEAQKVTQQEKIDEMVLERTRDLNNQMFDDSKEALDKKHEAETLALDEKYNKDVKRLDDFYTEAKIQAIAHQAIIDGTFANAQGSIVSISSAFKDFTIESGTSITTLVDKVNEFNNSLKNARDIINSMGSMNLSASVGVSTLPSYAVGATSLISDQIAEVHKNEAIIPANMNPFLGGKPLDNFMNLFPKSPSITPMSSSNGGITLNEPFLVIQGSVNENVMPEVRSLIKEGFSELTRMQRRSQNISGQVARA